MNTEEKISHEIQAIDYPLGTISTINEKGTPESASLYYIADEHLNIYFVTRSESRKHKNIQKNPAVAFVITSIHPPKTIQLEGVAAEALDPQDEINYFDKLVAKATENTIMPPVSQLVTGEMVFMKISTTWARFGNFEVFKEGDKFTETPLQ